MSKAKAKTIKLLLYEGDLTGVIKLEDASWTYSGILYSSPRDSVKKLFEAGACNKFGVYMLLSQNKVYVGQSSDLSNRIQQHLKGKDWWTSVVILTSSSDKLDATAIDYLESTLIKKASELQCLDCDNKNKGNPSKVGDFEKVELDQYLEEALFYLELIGITIFSETKSNENVLFDTLSSRLKFGKRGKTDALAYLRQKGINLPSNNKDINYSNKQQGSKEYWVNPKTEQLGKFWFLVLNNTIAQELLVLSIPANTFCLADKSHNGFKVRTDKPDLINLKIDMQTLVDEHSKIDFSEYVIHKVSY